MLKGRLEAFSDGVIAIIITIMVLELKVPQGTTAQALRPLIPIFISYMFSFIFIGIYWNNHHHLLHATKKISGRILWANHHLLFWLSLVPFVTAWMGENHPAVIPASCYGVVLLMAGIAYYGLAHELIRENGPNSDIALALGKDYKGVVSTVLYACAIPLAFVSVWISYIIFIGVAVMWFIPDQRIEKHLP
jgi:uncharacterized membrane protein